MNFRHSICTILFLLFSLSTINTAMAEDIAIIVHASNRQPVQLDDIAKIFLGKQHQLENGNGELIPIHLPGNDPLFQAFSELVLRKSTSQLNAYWAKRIFTGKGKPPENAQSRAEVKNRVSKSPNYLGYIDASSADDSVHVIITIAVE